MSEPHLSVWLENAVFLKCPECTRVYFDQMELDKHIVKHEEDKKLESLLCTQARVLLDRVDIYECSTCKACFLNNRQKVLHELKHIQKSFKFNKSKYADTEEFPKKYECPDCEARFVLYSTLEIHSETHKPFPNVCHCGIGFYKKQDLEGHKKLVHEKIKQWKPQIELQQKTIEREVVKKPRRSKYADTSEEDEDPFKDDDDDDDVEYTPKKKKRNLKRAAKIIKPKVMKPKRARKNEFLLLDGRYHCTECDKSYTQSQNLKNHILSHTGERNFVCKFCDKKFTIKNHLDRHENIHTSVKKYVCMFCQKIFADPSALTRHVRTHTGYKPYKCQHCPKEFSDNSAFYIHKKRHQGNRNIKCSFCDRSFFSHGEKTKHELIHTGVKKFECHDCGKTFISKNNLKIHILSQHFGQNVPYKKCKLCKKHLKGKNMLIIHMRKVHGVFRNRHKVFLATETEL